MRILLGFKSEGSLEKRLKGKVEEAGGLYIKLPAWIYRGIPDRLILLPRGLMYFIELKKQTGRTSIHQRRFVFKLRRLGFEAYIIRGEDQLEDFIREVVHVCYRLRNLKH